MREAAAAAVAWAERKANAKAEAEAAVEAGAGAEAVAEVEIEAGAVGRMGNRDRRGGGVAEGREVGPQVDPKFWNRIAATAAATTSPQMRQVEGGVSTKASRRLRSGDNALQWHDPLLLDPLTVAEVFSDVEESAFEEAMLAVVRDETRPLGNVFSRVQVM